jgi:hypothetical protein
VKKHIHIPTTNLQKRVLTLNADDILHCHMLGPCELSLQVFSIVLHQISLLDLQILEYGLMRVSDMQKHPSSLAVLAKYIFGIVGKIRQDSFVLQEYQWKAEELRLI